MIILSRQSQDKTSLLLFHRPSSTSTVNSCACLHTYTMHTIPKSFTCVPSHTSTRCLHISWHLAVSTSYLTSKTFEAPPMRQLSASAPCGSVGRKWVLLSRDPRTQGCKMGLRSSGYMGTVESWRLLSARVAYPYPYPLTLYPTFTCAWCHQSPSSALLTTTVTSYPFVSK